MRQRSITSPSEAYKELQGSDFSEVRLCSQVLWDEIARLRAENEKLDAT